MNKRNTMYFAILRSVTGLFGAVLTAVAVGLWIDSDGTTDILIGSMALGLVGVYLMVAALIPQRSVTEEVGTEVLLRLILELPWRLMGRWVVKIFENF